MNRKELKKSARQHIRRHYLKMLFICLLAAILGVEYGNTLELFNARHIVEVRPEGLETLKEIRTSLMPGDDLGGIWSDILSGKLLNISDSIRDRLASYWNSNVNVGHVELGHSRGVFASLINLFASGEYLKLAITTLDTVTGSATLSANILSVLGFIVAITFRAFFMNAYIVIMKRLFLEARIYEELPASRFLYLMRIRKWFEASLSMILYNILLFISALVPILRYMYFLTPHLVAENPSLTPIEALRVSRRMMYGHKFEAFKLMLSMFPWRILSLLSGGLAGLFFTNAYNEAVQAEYYAFIRSTCLEDETIAAYLTDKYLFRHADSKVLRRAYSDTVALMETPIKLPETKGIWGFLARNFGVILTYGEEEQVYRKATRLQLQIDSYKDALEGKIYPARLSVFHEHRRSLMSPNTDFMRHYSVPSLIAMYFIFSSFGWFWEVVLHLVEYGTFVNRGVLHGPMLPIYGTGGLLILTVLYRLRKHPSLEFIGAVVLCGVIEYGTSYILEIVLGQKWWDYSGYFINLNGRICAEGLLVFGIGAIVVVYLVAPVLDDYLAQIRGRIIWSVTLALLLLLVGDTIYSSQHPNIGEGVTDDNAGGIAVMAQTDEPVTKP